MNKLLIYIAILILLSGVMVRSQALDSKGTIVNSGTIKVKSMIKSTEQGAFIENNGKIVVEGNAFINQDSIGGKVEYTANDNSSRQIIPHLIYKDIMFDGKTRKTFDTTFGRRFVAADSFKTWKGVELLLDTNQTLFTKGWISQGGGVNLSKLFGRISMIGGRPQDIEGFGSFKILELDNTFGADVINTGGFRVDRALELVKGDFRNSATNNFTMADSTDIIRHVGASLSTEPIFENRVNVTYKGVGDIATSGEIPKASASLQKLYAENTGDVILNKNTTVNDSVRLSGSIHTRNDTLTLTSTKNPSFNRSLPSSEIQGNLRRTNLKVGDTLYLNNPYTWMYFGDEASKSNMISLTSTIRPKTYSRFDLFKSKVVRGIELVGLNELGNEIKVGINMDFGFGWRDKSGNPIDETNGLILMDLVLQRWTGSDWFDFPTEKAKVNNVDWAYSYVTKLSTLGSFAIGSQGFVPIVFQGRVFLEGPYMKGPVPEMSIKLNEMKLLTQTRLDKYPLNLISNLNQSILSNLPDSVVDFVVLEFRKDRNSLASIVKAGFIRYDGVILDENGNETIRLTKGDGIDSGGGLYHVIVRHRNHNSIITQEPVAIIPDNNSKVYDFTKPDLIEGGASAMKLVDILADGRRVFAMRGGYLVEDAASIQNQFDLVNNLTKEYDYKSSWQKFTIMGYDNSDFNMNGIITTKDYNVSWNNRAQK